MSFVKLLSVVGLFAITCNLAFAKNASQAIPYYGDNFYADMNSGIQNDDLKRAIKFVLESAHVKKENGMDDIVSTCGNKNCYRHVSLGYDTAREYLLGNFYLVSEGGGQYGLKDVYCNTVRSSSEFGSNPPEPGSIPSATVVNTEHTWPQSRFSGRYNRGTQKSDMHHLYPTDNEMNSVRSSNNFGEVVKDKKYLRCKESRYGTPAGGNHDVFEPPTNHKGNVARSLFYFSVKYEIQIDETQEATLRKWSKEDPVDEEEIRRNDFIHELQGNRNPFIDFPNLEDYISNL